MDYDYEAAIHDLLVDRHHAGDAPTIIFVFLIVCTKPPATSSSCQAYKPGHWTGNDGRRGAARRDQVRRRQANDDGVAAKTADDEQCRGGEWMLAPGCLKTPMAEGLRAQSQGADLQLGT